MANNLWHQQTAEETAASLDSNIHTGLTAVEVKRREQQFSNQIEEGAKNNPAKMLISQLTDTMILVLLGATVISGIVGAMADAITIMTIVIINAVLGFIQEYKAEKSLAEIKKLASPFTYTIRDGKRCKVPTSELVPGDIIIIESGDRIPADVRLIESFGLEIEEAALTGESIPVVKEAGYVFQSEVPITEQKNMAFMGTSVTRGRGRAVVVSTGMDTVMGQIASMIKNNKQDLTPLQAKLDQLGKTLIIICLAVCAVVSFLGIYRGEPALSMLMAGISLAVAAVPEGLPAIVTVVLALGVQRMAKSNAIIRKLPAVETLGCTTVICSDKTGTLTQNKMTVKKIATLENLYEVKENNIHIGEGVPFKTAPDIALLYLLEIAQNCNNVELQKVNDGYDIQGDPTEAALLLLARKKNVQPPLTRLREVPFDSTRKMMSVVVEKDGNYYVMAKGALDVLVDSCINIMKDNKVQPLTTVYTDKLFKIQNAWAENALRVLGFAFKKIDEKDIYTAKDDWMEKGLTLVGICGMIDPPRAGVEKSVAECLHAGITPVMITGDHPVTARAIAMQIGIGSSHKVINGNEIDDLSDEELAKRALEDCVFARVSPQHKNRIVKVLKKRQQVVAMTGDGVNDAPAVKAADIGIAMGITGTEVTKEASSMILADDDFSTIVRAIHEGRAIYDNIRKFIRYLLGGNIGEVLVMLMASLFAMPLPLLPIQILWVNLVTDGLPAMALGLEPPEPGIMERKPRPRSEGIFAHNLGWIICGRGLYIAIVTLLTFIIGLIYNKFIGCDGLETARTMAFTTLVFAQLFYVFECRSERYSPFELGFFTNRFLVVAVLCSITMQLGVIYLPFCQEVFSSTALNWWEWGLILLLAGAKFIWRYLIYFGKRFKVD